MEEQVTTPASNTSSSSPENDDDDSSRVNDEELGAIITRKCAVCGTTENEKAMLKCPLCGSVYYCSEKCQQQDWEKHQSVCLSKTSPMKVRHMATRSVSRFVVPAPAKRVVKVAASSVDAARVPQKEVVSRCEVMRCMMKPIEDMVFKQYAALSTADITRIASVLQRALDLTTEVTCSSASCAFVRSVGYYDMFIRKERDLTVLCLKACFHVYNEATAVPDADEDITARGRFAEEHAMALCKHVLEQHLGDTKNESRLQGVLLALELLLNLRDEQYDKHYPEFYVTLAHMIGDHRRNVRALVCKHFERVGKRIGITAAKK